MKSALAVLAILVLWGCVGDPLPTPSIAPTRPLTPHAPVPSQLTYLIGKVVDERHACIVGAVVHVVRGQRAGKTVTQSTPCDDWSYEEGFSFTELTPGVAMTIRASASGFHLEEKTIVPKMGEQEFVMFRLSRMK